MGAVHVCFLEIFVGSCQLGIVLVFVLANCFWWWWKIDRMWIVLGFLRALLLWPTNINDHVGKLSSKTRLDLNIFTANDVEQVADGGCICNHLITSINREFL